MAECIFCDVMDGKLQSHVIYDDDDCLAILDKYPIDNGHSLIITRQHYEKITDMSIDDVSRLFSKVPKIINAIIKATGADAFSIAQNNGKSAKQIIPHVHIHLIPRYNATGTLWTKRKIMSDDELKQLAEKIKNCF
ncbi:MAG: HIT family protein [Thaumarchaeota archaeon]|nr:HIT family protein [Nitrososphaerota archaeon]